MVSILLGCLRWAIWGFVHVKAKSFELRSKEVIGGIRFAERSRRTYQTVILGKPSVMWLRSMVEELIRGMELREFYRLFRSRSIVYIA